MKELLNKLIEKGWKPFGDNAIKIDYDGMKTRCGYGAITYKYRGSYIDDYGDEVEYEEWKRQFNNRELVSKESGLWQFVCSKGLVEMHELFYWQNIFFLDSQEYDCTHYQYWILESSLIDEDRLEKFILDNIKVS